MKRANRRLRELAARVFRVNELFSRIIVIFCIGYMVRVTERCLDIAEGGGSSQSLLQYAAMFFGGELVLLITKRLTKDIGETKAECARIASNSRIDTD